MSVPDTSERRDVKGPIRMNLTIGAFSIQLSPSLKSQRDCNFPAPWSSSGQNSVYFSASTGFPASNRMVSNSPISGAQLRAARALLKWSVRELSERCRVSRSAISRAEKVDGSLAMQLRNLNSNRRTFEEHGIEFIGVDGVRLLPMSSKD